MSYECSASFDYGFVPTTPSSRSTKPTREDPVEVGESGYLETKNHSPERLTAANIQDVSIKIKTFCESSVNNYPVLIQKKSIRIPFMNFEILWSYKLHFPAVELP